MPGIPTKPYVIQDLETLRVVADPLRSQILDLLIQEPQTVKQVADKLGDSPHKLYYHFSLLEKQRLIEVSETRLVANMLEKVYRAAARHIDVDPSLISFTSEEGRAAMHAFVTPVIDATRQDLVRSLQARQSQIESGAVRHPRPIFIAREASHIPDARIVEFSERLQALVAEFVDAGEGVPTAESPCYALTVAFYPSFYYTPGGSEK
ncbi:MAG: helix-turn-helix domain-containing protein [Chloroflexota bacterium]